MLSTKERYLISRYWQALEKYNKLSGQAKETARGRELLRRVKVAEERIRQYRFACLYS